MRRRLEALVAMSSTIMERSAALFTVASQAAAAEGWEDSPVFELPNDAIASRRVERSAFLTPHDAQRPGAVRADLHCASTRRRRVPWWREELA